MRKRSVNCVEDGGTVQQILGRRNRNEERYSREQRSGSETRIETPCLIEQQRESVSDQNREVEIRTRRLIRAKRSGSQGKEMSVTSVNKLHVLQAGDKWFMRETRLLRHKESEMWRKDQKDWKVLRKEEHFYVKVILRVQSST